MPSSKRGATNSGNEAKKRKKTPVEENVALLVESFDNEAYEFPCAESLKSLIPTVLCVPVENRHEFQEQFFTMVDQAVGEARGTLEARCIELQNDLAGGDRAKAEIEVTLVATNGEIQKIEAEIEVAETFVREAAVRLQDGQNMLDAAILTLENERVDFDRHTADFEELDAEFVELFLNGAMKVFIEDDSHRESLQKLVAKFLVVGSDKAPIIDASLAALYKDPAARTKFDTHALDLFEDIFENKLSAIKKLIAQTRPDFSKRDTLQAEVERLTNVLDGEKAKLSSAKSTKKELQSKLKSLEKRLKSHPSKMKDVETALSSVVDTLECFDLTVVPANKFLQGYTEGAEATETEGEQEDVTDMGDLSKRVEVPANDIESMQTAQRAILAEQAQMAMDDDMNPKSHRSTDVFAHPADSQFTGTSFQETRGSTPSGRNPMENKTSNILNSARQAAKPTAPNQHEESRVQTPMHLEGSSGW